VTAAHPGDEVAFATIRELGARYRTRELSPVEVTQALLARIERLDPTIRSYVTVTADAALAEARAAEATLSRGDRSRPLLGIPVAHKDIIATRGVRTTGGSALLADWVPDTDATVVTRLRQAGTVSLGKLIPHEFAFGIQFPGHRFPPARNPWSLDHVSGGSSSGSGAAPAAGLAVGALGTDTGGSIRLPAALSGVAGLKPTYGRVSRAGVLPLGWTLDHVGPMARTVEDCAYLLQALAGHDPTDPTSSRAPVPDYVAALGGDLRAVRIGVPRAYFLDALDTDMEAAFTRALEVLRELGASVRSVEIPSIEATSAGLLIMLVEGFTYHEPNLRQCPELYGDVLRERLLAGALFTGSEYVHAQQLRSRLAADVEAIFRTVDVLATPTARGPAGAFSVVLDPKLGFPRYNTLPFNMTGHPALAVPCGFSRHGLPLSLQLAGRAFEEATVLRVGHAYEAATEWHERRPPL
jgi:aspartyl-tRNA(Asn)/glutamyl-tRNA(Gln) amidotransferase subunit A